jgi:hypothetical protein
MNFRSALLCGLSLLGAAGCTADTVKPSPTADQVMAEQYRARGGQGAMSGSEAGGIAEAYRQQIARPSQAAPSETTEDRSVK